MTGTGVVWVAGLAAAVSAGLLIRPPALARLGPGDRTAWFAARVAAAAGALWRRVLGRLPGAAGADSPPAEVARWCELMAVAVEAGLPLRGALRAVVDVGEGRARDQLAQVVERLDLGVDEQRAWLALADDGGWHDAARDVARSVRHGVAAAQALRGHALQARLAARSDALVRARRAGVLAVVPLVLCFLPAFLLLGVVPVFGGLVGGLFR